MGDVPQRSGPVKSGFEHAYSDYIQQADELARTADCTKRPIVGSQSQVVATPRAGEKFELHLLFLSSSAYQWAKRKHLRGNAHNLLGEKEVQRSPIWRNETKSLARCYMPLVTSFENLFSNILKTEYLKDAANANNQL